MQKVLIYDLVCCPSIDCITAKAFAHALKRITDQSVKVHMTSGHHGYLHTRHHSCRSDTRRTVGVRGSKDTFILRYLVCSVLDLIRGIFVLTDSIYPRTQTH